ncbi:MAG TPA: type II secretion system F family protein [Polyangia bacterium]|jgi:type IV pilus assembly protein PilC|nr:type II secretion system F family protein [Polyangia bacterium]
MAATAFVWEARARNGDVKKGVMEADNEEAVHEKLQMQMLSPLMVKKQPKQLSISFGTGVKVTDVVIFTRMFATMIDAGLPIVQCLEILSTQADNKRFGKVLGQIKSSVEDGFTLSDALSKHPQVFDDLFVNLVAAGEAGGILDSILQRLSIYMEKAMKLRRRVKGAMMYPISIVCIAAIVVTILLTKVIPVFEKMFKDFGGGKLPMPTQIVIDISHALAQFLPYIIAALIAMGVGMKMLLRRPKGRLAFDGTLLKLPVLGAVLRKVVVARFTRTMGTLLSSGVPILDAMEICARTAGNTVVQAGIMYSREQISQGKDMASPLMETGLMPPMVVQMIGVGEQTGALDSMLSKIADFYEEEVDVAVASMTSLIEPIMMVFLGAVIGGMVVAMYLPIFEMAGNIKAG